VVSSFRLTVSRGLLKMVEAECPPRASRFLFPRLILVLLFAALPALRAAALDHFEPLADTLGRYGVHSIPSADQYPGVPPSSCCRSKSTGSWPTARAQHPQSGQNPYGRGQGVHDHFHSVLLRVPHPRPNHQAERQDHQPRLPGTCSTRRVSQSTRRPSRSSTFLSPEWKPGTLFRYKAEVTYPEPFLAEDYRFATAVPPSEACSFSAMPRTTLIPTPVTPHPVRLAAILFRQHR